MKVTVHAEGSAKEIAAQLNEHAAIYAGGGKAAPAPAAVAGAKKGKKAKEDEEEFDLEEQEEDESEETEEESEEEETEEESEDEDADEAEDDGPSLEDMVSAFQKYAKKTSRDKAAAVLKKFKVKSVRDLKAKDYKAVLKSLK